MLYITKHKYKLPVTTDSSRLAFPKAWELYNYLVPEITESPKDLDNNLPAYFSIWEGSPEQSAIRPELIPDFSMQQDWFDEQQAVKAPRSSPGNKTSPLRDIVHTKPDAIYAAARQIATKLGSILLVCCATKQEIATDPFLRRFLLDPTDNKPRIPKDFLPHVALSEKMYWGVPTKALFSSPDQVSACKTFLQWARYDITYKGFRLHDDCYYDAKRSYKELWLDIDAITKLPAISSRYVLPLPPDEIEYYFKTYTRLWDTDDKDQKEELSTFLKTYPYCYLREYLVHTKREEASRERKAALGKKALKEEKDELTPKENESAEKYLLRTAKSSTGKNSSGKNTATKSSTGKNRAKKRFTFEKLCRFILSDCENQAEFYDFFEEGINADRIQKAITSESPAYLSFRISVMSSKTGKDSDLVLPFAIIYDEEDKTWQVAAKDTPNDLYYPIVYDNGRYWFADSSGRKLEVWV